jgi:hypothetical protein
MDRRKLLRAGGVAAAAAAVAPGAALAKGGSDQGAAGSWFGRVTAVNPPLGSFDEMLSLIAGGVAIESRRYYVVPPPPFPNLLETTGHGAWKRTGNRRYEVFFRFLLQEPPPSAGNPIGTDNIRLFVRYDPEAETLSGTFVSQVRDVAGDLLIQVEGTYEATRITV